VVSDVHNSSKSIESSTVSNNGSLAGIITGLTCFDNQDGSYHQSDASSKINGESMPVSNGNKICVELTDASDGYAITGINKNVQGWYYQYESLTGKGEWKHGDLPTVDPADYEYSLNAICKNTYDSSTGTVTIGVSGKTCYLTSAMKYGVSDVSAANPLSAAVNSLPSGVHKIVIVGNVIMNTSASMTVDTTADNWSAPWPQGVVIGGAVSGSVFASSTLTDVVAGSGSRLSSGSGFNASSMFMNSPLTGDVSGITSMDTSGFTNMSQMFQGSSFNGDVSGWDTSNVTSMAYMFMNTSAFNRPIGTWDTSKVTDMSSMFAGNTTFNQNLNGWKDRLGSVTTMASMFSGDYRFNNGGDGYDDKSHPLSWGRIGKQPGVNLSNMFETRDTTRPSQFNQDMSGTDVSNVTNMSAMFTELYGGDNFDNGGRSLSAWKTMLGNAGSTVPSLVTAAVNK
jgi:surface protein